jgi:hypothetical protein
MRIWSSGKKASNRVRLKLPQWLLDLDLGTMSRRDWGYTRQKEKKSELLTLGIP